MSLERHQAEDLLYKEARLIDEGNLDDWLTLFTQDSHYWIPAGRYDIDPMREVSIIYDDRQRMEERVWRIQSGIAWAQEPLSRTRHVVSNVEVLNSTDDEATVSSYLILFEMRRGAQGAFAGR